MQLFKVINPNVETITLTYVSASCFIIAQMCCLAEWRKNLCCFDVKEPSLLVGLLINWLKSWDWVMQMSCFWKVVPWEGFLLLIEEIISRKTLPTLIYLLVYQAYYYLYHSESFITKIKWVQQLYLFKISQFFY